MATSDRVYFLDWLRIGALGLLILYHTDLPYVLNGWLAQSPHARVGESIIGAFVREWQMALLFLVAGAAMRFSVVRDGPRMALAGRLRRIGPPILLGLVVLAPVQTWCAALAGHDLSGLGEGQRLLEHVWFLPFLLLYVALAAAFGHGAPDADRGARALAGRALKGGFAVAAPIALIVVAALLGLHAPRTYAIWSDLAGHVKYGGMFALGFLAGEALWPRFEAQRWRSLALAVLFGGLACAAGPLAHQSVVAILAAAFGGATLAAMCGFGRRLLNRNSDLLRALNRAVMPIYLLHQPIIVALMLALAPLRWPEPLERGALVALTLGLSWIGYRLFDLGPQRVLVGLAPPPRPRSAGATGGVLAPAAGD